MSDPHPEFQAPPPPHVHSEPEASRPVHLRPVAIGLFVVGVLVLVTGIIKILPGGTWTGLAFAFWGILLFAFSFIALPQATGAAEPPLSALEKLAGIFYEPGRVFRNLRTHPRWLAAFLVVAVVSVVYAAAFVQRLTPDRIVDYTMEKLEQSPIKPPPEAMEKAKADALLQAKQPVQRVQTAAKSFVGIFVLISFLAALYLLLVLVFGGRINFWQAFSATAYSMVPIVLVQKGLSLVILFIKSPDDIHPILGQETLVQDNLGVLFLPAEHPVFFVLASAIGVLSLYGLWLRASGLRHAGTKVSSSAGWGAAITLWILGLFLITVITAIFPSFIS